MRGMIGVPMLHIASDAAWGATEVNWPIVTIGSLVLSALVGYILVQFGLIRLPRVARRVRMRALSCAFAIVTVLAVLPAVFPYDHLIAGDSSQEAEHVASHAQHCHVASATCSDAPVGSGPGQFLFSSDIVPSLRFVNHAIHLDDATILEVSLNIATPPPRT
jgi:hypothetical protein